MSHKLPPFYKRLRFATSFIATWLMNLGMFGWSLKSVCAPGLNCHGCVWATGACPVGAIAFGSALRSIPIYAIAFVLAIGVVLGRLVCSFMCPFGLLQDLIHKIPSPKIHLPRWFRYGKYLALVFLVFLLPWALGFDVSSYMKINAPEVNKADGGKLEVKINLTNMGTEPIIAPMVEVMYKRHDNGQMMLRQNQTFEQVTVQPATTMTLPAIYIENHLSDADLVLDSPLARVDQNPKYQLYFCKVCPAGTLTASIPSYFMASDSTWIQRVQAHWLRLSVLAVFLVLMMISSRPVCRGFCPLGAMYGLLTPVSLMRFKVNNDICTGCEICDKSCPVELDVRTEIGGRECISCGDCAKVCPKSGIKRVWGL